MIVSRNEGNKINLASWSDSDYAADKVDRKSVTGGVLTMDVEAEFASASHVVRKLLGLRELMREIGFQVEAPMSMLMDNQSVIRQLETEGSVSSVKHVDVRIKFICDYARKVIVRPMFVESSIMKEDLLKKVLPVPRVAELRKMFNLM
uniref:Polyprotein n=1 Tax=Peronospora matthiolae TaxID=2874970 RepID=A0AAV1SZ62_9STRA